MIYKMEGNVINKLCVDRELKWHNQHSSTVQLTVLKRKGLISVVHRIATIIKSQKIILPYVIFY